VAAGGFSRGTNGHEIVVADFPDAARSKGDQGLGATAPRSPHLSPCARGPCSARRHQACGSSPATSPIRGYEPRHVAASGDKRDADDDGRLPGRSIQDGANRIFMARIRSTRRLAVLGHVLDAQCLDKFLPAVQCEPEAFEESGLEAGNRVCCGEQVLAQLRWLDRRPISSSTTCAQSGAAPQPRTSERGRPD
jgi:hypothetical protein